MMLDARDDDRAHDRSAAAGILPLAPSSLADEGWGEAKEARFVQPVARFRRRHNVVAYGLVRRHGV